MICPNCGHELSDRATLCPYCGSSWSHIKSDEQNAMRYCIHCGREIPVQSAFCIYCGQAQPTKAESSVRPPDEAENTSSSAETHTQSETDTSDRPIGPTKANKAGESEQREAHKDTATAEGGTSEQNAATTQSTTFRELAYELKSELSKIINEEGATRNDVVCPFCGEENCQPMQKSITEVKQKGYGWGSGCCGMLLFGPFGLFCGLCRTGSKVKTTNELWWTCMKCSKQHLALADALNKWDTMMETLLATAGFMAVVFGILRMFDIGILTVIAVIGSIAVPITWVSEYHKELSEELGGQLADYLSPDQKKKCIWTVLGAMAIMLVGSFIILRLWEYFLAS